MREPITIAMPQLFYGGLRRDALDHLPAGFVIGRAAAKRGALVQFFNYDPRRVLVAECSAKDCALLASTLESPIDFWNGEQWTSQVPRRSKRVVLYGSGLAGKTTILEGIAAAHGTSVTKFYVHAPDDHGLTCRGARVELPRSGIELSTLVGPTQNDGMWGDLLRGAAAVVLVLDGQCEREEANRAWVQKLANTQIASGCVVVTKLDLPNATFDMMELVRGTRLAGWPTARSLRGNVASATKAIDALLLTL